MAKEANQQIQDILGDFTETVKEITRRAIDGMIKGGFQGMEQAISNELNALYIRGREALAKKE